MRARLMMAGLHFEARWSSSGLQALRLLSKKAPGHKPVARFSMQLLSRSGRKGTPVPRACAVAAMRERHFLRTLRHTLRQFFRNRSSSFDVPLAWDGATDFQKEVWQALRKIPRGQTRSYAQIAQQIGRPRAARAVGAACAANPILLLVPCHRVIGSDGSLGGFSSGIALKKTLLDRERPISRSAL